MCEQKRFTTVLQTSISSNNTRTQLTSQKERKRFFFASSQVTQVPYLFLCGCRSSNEHAFVVWIDRRSNLKISAGARHGRVGRDDSSFGERRRENQKTHVSNHGNDCQVVRTVLLAVAVVQGALVQQHQHQRNVVRVGARRKADAPTIRAGLLLVPAGSLSGGDRTWNLQSACG